MLISLHIENIAVIKSIDFDFSEGFMVLTGETGAGKSVVIDSINLLLGSKAERELIRSGQNQAMVSGLFADLSEKTVDGLSALGIEIPEDGEILLQRVVSQDGKSRAMINGRSISLSLLKSVAPLLVSVHGQTDTASLQDSKNHLDILDVYANLGELKSEYQIAYSTLEGIRRQIREVTEKLSESERLKEILEYQIKDIESANLKEDEEDVLVEKRAKLKNSEKITKNSEFVFKALKGSEKGSVSYLLDRSMAALNQISDVVPNFAEYADRLRECLYQVDDIAEEVYAVIDDIDGDPTVTLNKIESRLDKISKLERKYGSTIKDVLEFCRKAKSELETLENSDGVLKELSQKERKAYNEALKLAKELHNKRAEAAKNLESYVKETLEFLDMPKVVFFVSLKEMTKGEERILTKDGGDLIEFYISANRGADPQPLAKIASGGELSRIMLALKSVISDKDGIPTVIYDEIDTGVSGKTARKIGIKMLSLSKTTQLFSVTHSAQIASLADKHFLISKGDINGETETSVKILDTEGRICELSRILGGINITSAQRAAAEDMLAEKSNYQ
jgi:DNA repair protein RecN (Recombination protein N)